MTKKVIRTFCLENRKFERIQTSNQIDAAAQCYASKRLSQHEDPKKIRLSLSIEKMLTASELMVYVTIKFFCNCTKCMFNMLLFTGSMSNYFSAVVGLATVFVNYVNLV